MKRGFNKYGNVGRQQDQQASQPSQQNNRNQGNPHAMVNQFTSFSPENNGFSDTMIVSLFQVVQQQSQALQTLMKKVEVITERTVELTQKIKQLKTSKVDEKEGHQKEKTVVKTQAVKGGADILNPRQLITILFGDEKKYDFKLRLAQKLELPLFRERNFFLEMELCDSEGNPIKNSNKIPLSLALYSTENPPKFIEKNTAGQKILKGYIQQSLHQGLCRFQKIQIKQVTSHFRNGWVFIVIIPCMTPLGSAVTCSETNIDYTRIEPLVLDRIVVKAKKLKETKMESHAAPGEDMEVEQVVKNGSQFYDDQK